MHGNRISVASLRRFWGGAGLINILKPDTIALRSKSWANGIPTRQRLAPYLLRVNSFRLRIARLLVRHGFHEPEHLLQCRGLDAMGLVLSYNIRHARYRRGIE